MKSLVLLLAPDLQITWAMLRPHSGLELNAFNLRESLGLETFQDPDLQDKTLSWLGDLLDSLNPWEVLFLPDPDLLADQSAPPQDPDYSLIIDLLREFAGQNGLRFVELDRAGLREQLHRLGLDSTARLQAAFTRRRPRFGSVSPTEALAVLLLDLPDLRTEPPDPQGTLFLEG